MSKGHMLIFLQHFTIFKDLNTDETDSIADFAEKKEYAPHTIVFMQEDPITDVFFIQSGKVKIYKTDIEGNEQIVNILQKDDMFPHQGFFRKGNYPAHAEIIEEATLINIPIASFEQFLLTHPEVSIKMFRVLSEIIIDLQSRLEQKILYNVHEQVILLLMRLSKRNGERIEEDVYRLTVPFTNRELANMIGSSRETISRTLSTFKREGIVDTDETGHLLIHYEALEEKVLS